MNVGEMKLKLFKMNENSVVVLPDGEFVYNLEEIKTGQKFNEEMWESLQKDIEEKPEYYAGMDIHAEDLPEFSLIIRRDDNTGTEPPTAVKKLLEILDGVDNDLAPYIMDVDGQIDEVEEVVEKDGAVQIIGHVAAMNVAYALEEGREIGKLVEN